LSDQDTETKNNEDPKEETAGAEPKDVDSFADLSELEKIKLELQKEKEKAATELAEGEDEEEDLREVDYLQKLITLSVQFDHHCSMWLMPAHIDCGLKFNHQLSEAYANQLNTIQSFLRLLENVDGVTRELVTKDVILKLRNTLQLIFKNLVKPLILEVGRMKKKPKSESLDNFKTNWNERLAELQKACDFEYQVLDCKGFMIKE
jgi:vacuolar-type H+-ATPase subunit F/Vma7